MKSKVLEEMYAVLTAGGRTSGEQSHALESRYYGDPSKVIEFPAEVARKGRARKEKAVKLKKQSKHRNYRGK